MIAKPKKCGKGRVLVPPTLTRVELLTQGLMLPPDEVKANFCIKEDEKGRGVYLKSAELPKGAFVLEYEGDIISQAEVTKREEMYASNGEGCFIMDFIFRGKRMAIDATRRFDSYTRLLNHSRAPNIKFHSPLVVNVSEPPIPRIAAYALRDIKRGEEIVFDYGIKDHSIPWLKSRQVRIAEVSEDEEEKDKDSEDDQSDAASLTVYPCLRYTAARAGRLAEPGEHPTFDYREGLNSSSSSSRDSSSSSAKRSRRSKKSSRNSRKRKDVESALNLRPVQVNLGPCNLKHIQSLPSISEHKGSSEFRLKLTRSGVGEYYQGIYDSLGSVQKICKSLEEPKQKRRRTEDSGSIICLSDESSPSAETCRSSSSDTNRLLDIPEVSSEKKVMDWQSASSFENNELNIKIVGVQSLSDSPEHVPCAEPYFQGGDLTASTLVQPTLMPQSTMQEQDTAESSVIVDNQVNDPASVPPYPEQTCLQQSNYAMQQISEQAQQVQPIPSVIPQPSSPSHCSTAVQPEYNPAYCVSQQTQARLFTSSHSSQQSQGNVPNPLSFPSSSKDVAVVESIPETESPLTISDSEEQKVTVPSSLPQQSVKPDHLTRQPSSSNARNSSHIVQHSTGATEPSPRRHTESPSKPQSHINGVCPTGLFTSHRMLSQQRRQAPCTQHSSKHPPQNKVQSQNNGYFSHLNNPRQQVQTKIQTNSHVDLRQHQSLQRSENHSSALQYPGNKQALPDLSHSQLSLPSRGQSFPASNSPQQKNTTQQFSRTISHEQESFSQSGSSKSTFRQQNWSHSLSSMPKQHNESLSGFSNQHHEQQKSAASHRLSLSSVPKQQHNVSHSGFNNQHHGQQNTAAGHRPSERLPHQSQGSYQKMLKTPNNNRVHLVGQSNMESLVISDDEDFSKAEAQGSGTSKPLNCKIIDVQSVQVVSSEDESSDLEIIGPSFAQSCRTKNIRKEGFAPGYGNHDSDSENDESVYEQPASSTKKVAVIKPYHSNGKHRKEDQAEQCSDLTDSEIRHLSKIFEGPIFSNNLSQVDIERTMYENRSFFESIIGRGVTVDQIRTAVRIFFSKQ